MKAGVLLYWELCAPDKVLLALLQEYQFPVGKFSPLASECRAGISVRFNSESLLVKFGMENFDWVQAKIAFFVANGEISAQYAEEVANEVW